MQTIESDLLRIPAVSTRLDCCQETARKMIRKGIIPGMVRVGGSIRVQRSKLEAWIDGGGAVKTLKDGAR